MLLKNKQGYTNSVNTAKKLFGQKTLLEDAPKKRNHEISDSCPYIFERLPSILVLRFFILQ